MSIVRYLLPMVLVLTRESACSRLDIRAIDQTENYLHRLDTYGSGLGNFYFRSFDFVGDQSSKSMT